MNKKKIDGKEDVGERSKKKFVRVLEWSYSLIVKDCLRTLKISIKGQIAWVSIDLNSAGQ